MHVLIVTRNTPEARAALEEDAILLAVRPSLIIWLWEHASDGAQVASLQEHAETLASIVLPAEEAGGGGV